MQRYIKMRTCIIENSQGEFEVIHDPFVVFFSSRRRHTRFDCDWSSDVCSSDLDTWQVVDGWAADIAVGGTGANLAVFHVGHNQQIYQWNGSFGWLPINCSGKAISVEIGRASCRERV